MAGGEGSRVKHLLNDFPKQFTKINLSEKTLLDETIQRLLPIKKQSDTSLIVVTKEKFKSFVLNSEKISNFSLKIESDTISGTTAAMFSMIHEISQTYGNSVLAFFPSDHLVADNQKFTNTISKAMRLAEKSNRIFLLGCETKNIYSDFEYIIPDTEKNLTTDTFFVKHFVAKPREEFFEQLKAQNPLINLGIFIGTATSFLCAYLNAATHNQSAIRNSSNFDKDILETLHIKPVVIKYDSDWNNYEAVLLKNEKIMDEIKSEDFFLKNKNQAESTTS